MASWNSLSIRAANQRKHAKHLSLFFFFHFLPHFSFSLIDTPSNVLWEMDVEWITRRIFSLVVIRMDRWIERKGIDITFFCTEGWLMGIPMREWERGWKAMLWHYEWWPHMLSCLSRFFTWNFFHTSGDRYLRPRRTTNRLTGWLCLV